MKNNRFFSNSGLIVIASMAASCPVFAQEQAGTNDNIIVVTAQKREQKLQDIPFSISVVSGEELQEQGASSLVDYSGYVPGMQVTSSGTPGQGTVTLRGIAPLSGSSTVGTYLDDAPVGSSNIYNRANSFAIDLLPYDIQRVEVLKGPQGTLYGASSIGGLVKYVTVSPKTSGYDVRGGVEIFDVKGGDGFGWAANTLVSVPVVDEKLGVSGSFSWRSTPGWVDSVNNTDLDDQNDYEQRGGRVALLWTPTEALSVKLSGLWQSIDSGGNAQYAADLAGNNVGDGRSFNNILAEPFNFDLDYYAATIDYDFGGLTLTSATTYSQTQSSQNTDATYIFGVLFPLLTGGAIPPGLTPFTIDLGLEKWTQEFRLASESGGRFEWLVGGFYTEEDTTNTQFIPAFDMNGDPIAALNPLAIASLPATYKEYAVFGNGTFRFNEQFELTAGMRWAHNKQTFRQISSGSLVPVADDPGQSSESVFTYSVSPQFRINENAMIYARVASGYRPGGPNTNVPGIPPQVDSDSLTNYEVGIKAETAGGMVSLDVAAFYMDWSDIQITRTFGGISGQANGGKAKSQGIEGTLIVRPTAGLSLTATGSYTDATLKEDAPEINGLAGDRLPNTPKFSGAARLDYGFGLGEQANGSFGIGVRHSGARPSLVDSDPLSLRSEPFTSVDITAGVTFDEHWTLRAYARNVFDNSGDLNHAIATDGLNQPSFISITPLQPRTVGVALELDF
ncbi:TonB-dependent receptor [Parasphingorhabdus sp.]|uniref:TonB-dependent receptor n=1 Tax=Parasphingorhabdus sp. TaxID=2709688 RepID=UPI003A8F0AAF